VEGRKAQDERPVESATGSVFLFQTQALSRKDARASRAPVVWHLGVRVLPCKAPGYRG
jgi:hypothetical protein